MGITRDAIASYLISLYCSLAVLTESSLAVLDGVAVDKYHACGVLASPPAATTSTPRSDPRSRRNRRRSGRAARRGDSGPDGLRVLRREGWRGSRPGATPAGGSPMPAGGAAVPSGAVPPGTVPSEAPSELSAVGPTPGALDTPSAPGLPSPPRLDPPGAGGTSTTGAAQYANAPLGFGEFTPPWLSPVPRPGEAAGIGGPGVPGIAMASAPPPVVRPGNTGGSTTGATQYPDAGTPAGQGGPAGASPFGASPFGSSPFGSSDVVLPPRPDEVRGRHRQHRRRGRPRGGAGPPGADRLRERRRLRATPCSSTAWPHCATSPDSR